MNVKMKKLISVILILSMIFTLGITSMTASAKYQETITTTWEEVSCFDFDAYSSERIDYTKYENVFHFRASEANYSTTQYANAGHKLYIGVYNDSAQTFGKYRVKNSISAVAPGSVAFKLANVIDSTKFVAGTTYKVTFDYKPEGFTYAKDGSTSSVNYFAVGDEVTENVPFTAADLAGVELTTPKAYILANVTSSSAVSNKGAANAVTNGEWGTAQTAEFVADADKHIGTVDSAGTTYGTLNGILKASTLRFEVPTATAKINGASYTILPTTFCVDNVKVLKKVVTKERTDDPNYTKTYDGSSKTDITSCGDGANPPELITDFGHSDATSIKQTIKTTKEYIGAGIRVQKLFGDLPPVNEDIGKVFEVSAWIYPEKTDNIPEDSTGTYIQMAMAAPYTSTNAWTSFYKAATYYVPWNEWTQIKIYHKVAEDCSMDNNNADGKGYNGRCDAVRIQSADCALDGNVVNTFYIDDVTVREIETDVETSSRPKVQQTLYKSEDGREDAMYSKIVITPGNNIKINKMYAYMLPTSLITNNIKNELAIADKKVVNLPKVNGEGTVTIFSVLTGIPATNIDITSKVAFTCDAPYLYGEQSGGTYYSSISSTVAELLNK